MLLMQTTPPARTQRPLEMDSHPQQFFLVFLIITESLGVPWRTWSPLQSTSSTSNRCHDFVLTSVPRGAGGKRSADSYAKAWILSHVCNQEHRLIHSVCSRSYLRECLSWPGLRVHCIFRLEPPKDSRDWALAWIDRPCSILHLVGTKSPYRPGWPLA